MIHISDRWEIDTDPRNYILIESHEVKKKDGSTVITSTRYGFYPTLSLCLKAIIQQENLDMIGDGYISLREALRRSEEIEKRVYKEFLDGVCGTV